jgi:hypothetical protein
METRLKLIWDTGESHMLCNYHVATMMMLKDLYHAKRQ